MTFYLDIILFENMIMNYIILFATGLIAKANIKHLRLVLSSFIGSLYAIMSYILKMPLYHSRILKLILSITMIYIAFYPKSIKKLIQEMVLFYLTSFCFGGAAYYLLYYISPVQINNIGGILTGSYPIKIALLGGILGFFLMTIGFYLVKKRVDRNSLLYTLEIGYQEKKCSLKAMLDTGNLLVEPITSLPVVIVEKSKLEEIIPKDNLKLLLEMLEGSKTEKLPQELKLRSRLIPFSSIGRKNGMMIGIKPDYIRIFEEDNETVITDVIIGIYQDKLSKNGAYNGLMGLELLNYEGRKIGEKNEYYSNVKG